MSQRINGLILSYAHLGVSLCVALILTPILIFSLGTEGYGLFILTGSLTAYLYLLDFRLNDGVIRFFVAHEREQELRQAFLSRMLCLYTFFGLLVLAGTFGLKEIVSLAFSASLSSDEITTFQQMVFVTGLGAAVLVACKPATALLTAMEQFVFLRGLEIVGLISSSMLIAVLLSLGYREIMIVSVMAGNFAIKGIVSLIYLHMSLGQRLSFLKPDTRETMRLIVYAVPIFLFILADTLFWKIDSILIGKLLGAMPVAIYAIGVTFRKYLMNFATAISRIMTPEIIRLVDDGADAEALTSILIRISRLQAFALLLVLGGLIVFGQRFINLWVGDEFADSYWVMVVVLVPYTLDVIGGVRNVVLQVKGVFWFKTTITVATAIANIPLTIWLLSLWGVIGAAVSTGIALLMAYSLTSVIVKRYAGVSIMVYLRETTRGIMPVFLSLVIGGLFLEQQLMPGWGGLVLGALVFTVLYVAAMALLAANSYEISLTRRLIFSLKCQLFGR